MIDMSRGLFVGIIVGTVSTVPILVMSRGSPLFSLLGVIVVPLLIICIVMPRRHFRLVNVLVPIVISELIFGGAGRWIGVGMFSGRQILFVIVLAAWIIDYLTSLKGVVSGRFWRYVLLAGFVAPLFWLLWSLGRGAQLQSAFGDLSFLFFFLAYFPISTWLRDGPAIDWAKGYIGGLLVMLAALWIFIPMSAWKGTMPLTALQWFAGNIAYFPNGFPRLSFNVDVFFPVGIWLGLFMWTWQLESNVAPSRSVRTSGFILFASSAVALALTFSRAFWLAFVLVAFIGLGLGNVHWIARRQARQLQMGLCIAALMVVALMANLSPEGLGRFYTVFDSSNQANQIRTEERVELVRAWKTSPLLGNGFGIALPSGYVRSSEAPYLFELQYYALLSKSGVVGLLLIIMVPFAAFIMFRRSICQLFQPAKSSSAFLLFSLASGVLVTSIAGAFNPYLMSAYFPFLAAFLFALYDAVPN